MSAGELLTDEARRDIRIVGEFKDVSEIEDVIVKYENQDIVYLRDIATVSFDYIEPNSYARLDGENVVTLDVKKKSGGNLIQASEQIQEIINEAKEEGRFPEELKIIITNDQSRETKLMVQSLENNIISGVILVVLVLLFFLGLRNASFVGIAIPMSMLMAFLILNAFGITLNMMVLFSLILALGMLVDNGIVVVENTYRLMSEGKSPIRAAIEGVGEVAWPIIASTATTVAAFVPLLFWNNLMGEFMKYLPLTLIITLSSSLFVGLVINPVIASQFMKVQNTEGGSKKPTRNFWYLIIGAAVISILAHLAGATFLGNLAAIVALVALLNRFVLQPASVKFQNGPLVKLEGLYRKTITFALKGYRPVWFFVGTFLLFLGSCASMIVAPPKTLYFPEGDPTYVNVFVAAPLGTDITKTNIITKQVEQKLKTTLADDAEVIEATLAQVGEGTSDPNEGISMGNSPHRGRVTVSFVPFEEREGKSTSDIMEKIRASIKDIPGAQITVSPSPFGPPVGPPINVEISGENFTELVLLTDVIKDYLDEAGIPGIEELKTDLETGKPELVLTVDRSAAKRYGVSTADVAMSMRTALFGKEISKYKEGEDDYPIMLRYDDEERYNLNSLMNTRITFRDQATGKISQVPVSAVAELDYASTYGSIKRKDLDRVITIYSNVNVGYNANEINTTLKERLAEYDMPEGFAYKFTGQQEDQEADTAFLTNALIIAVLLIFLIMVSQFNSVLMPIIILTSVLFSMIGVLLGIQIFNMDFVILMTGIGIISLAGVVVNNAIVLIDFVELERKRRALELDLESSDDLSYSELVASIIRAGSTRMRPVLLTAITTVLGLLPLAIGINLNFFTLLSDFDAQFYIGGDNVMFWGPLAWAVIFGLSFATFLTLVIVPVTYLLIDRAKMRVLRLFGIRKPVQSGSLAAGMQHHDNQ
jgi:multidrug efflux pump subunit AcrB